MTTQVRHPIWFFAVRPAGARTFATLYGLESFARASISSVIPIQAYEILRNEQGVSILYTVVALLGLSATLFMPMLIERFSRRWIYTAGVLSLILGSVFFVSGTLAGQVFGLGHHVHAAAFTGAKVFVSWIFKVALTLPVRPSSNFTCVSTYCSLLPP